MLSAKAAYHGEGRPGLVLVNPHVSLACVARRIDAKKKLTSLWI